MKTLALLLVLLASPALAGIDVIQGVTSWELHLDDGKTNPIVKGDWPTDLPTCVTKINALAKDGEKYMCVMRVKFEAHGTCTEEWKTPPVFELKQDADGSFVLPEARAKPKSETEWTTEQFAFVHGAYPTCWIAGWAEITEWDSHGQFEGPPVMEPVYGPGEAPPP